jgi:hypothetical protein
MEYEYQVIPAPKRLKRRKGVTSSVDLLAATLTECINAEAREGWEYVRSEQLSAEEPGGWFRRAALVEETMMVFRRPRRSGPNAETAHRGEAAEEADVRGHPAYGLARSRTPVAAGREVTGPDRRPAPPRAQEANPPLLRPVPRFTPNDKA